MSGLIRLNNCAILQNIVYKTIRNNRTIKTSSKNRDTAAAAAYPPVEVPKAKTANWMSYGFDRKDKATDRSTTKSSFFFSVTLCLVWGTFVWSYLPDTQLRNWAQREGFLELRRREKAGLDLISPNYVDPALIELPSDEDLGDTEIII